MWEQTNVIHFILHIVLLFGLYICWKLSDISRLLERIAAKLDGLPPPREKTWKERFEAVLAPVALLFALLFLGFTFWGLWYAWHYPNKVEQALRDWQVYQAYPWLSRVTFALGGGFFVCSAVYLTFMWRAGRWDEIKRPETAEFLSQRPLLTIILVGGFGLLLLLMLLLGLPQG